MPELLTLDSLVERLARVERFVGVPSTSDDPPGTLGDPQSDEPEAVARWLAAFDAIPAVTMTADEEKEWAASRQATRTADRAMLDQLTRRFAEPGE